MKPSIRCLFVEWPFDAFARQMAVALDASKIGAREKGDLLKLFGQMKKDIVSK